MDFVALKLLIIDATGLAKDALHVHIGLAAFILTRLVWRGRWGWTVAWLVALVGAVSGEWLDARGEAARGIELPAGAHWHDVWNTLLWPSVLLIVGRWLQPAPSPSPITEQSEIKQSGTIVSSRALGQNGEQPFEQA